MVLMAELLLGHSFWGSGLAACLENVREHQAVYPDGDKKT